MVVVTAQMRLGGPERELGRLCRQLGGPGRHLGGSQRQLGRPLMSGIAPAQRAQLLGDLIDEVDLLQVIGR